MTYITQCMAQTFYTNRVWFFPLFGVSHLIFCLIVNYRTFSSSDPIIFFNISTLFSLCLTRKKSHDQYEDIGIIFHSIFSSFLTHILSWRHSLNHFRSSKRIFQSGTKASFLLYLDDDRRQNWIHHRFLRAEKEMKKPIMMTRETERRGREELSWESLFPRSGISRKNLLHVVLRYN